MHRVTAMRKIEVCTFCGAASYARSNDAASCWSCLHRLGRLMGLIEPKELQAIWDMTTGKGKKLRNRPEDDAIASAFSSTGQAAENRLIGLDRITRIAA